MSFSDVNAKYLAFLKGFYKSSVGAMFITIDETHIYALTPEEAEERIIEWKLKGVWHHLGIDEGGIRMKKQYLFQIVRKSQTIAGLIKSKDVEKDLIDFCKGFKDLIGFEYQEARKHCDLELLCGNWVGADAVKKEK